MTIGWPKGFKPTSKGMPEKKPLTPASVEWNSAQCAECVDLREALRKLATLEHEKKQLLLDIEILQLEKRWLQEDLLQYTRDFTNMEELANE